MTRILFATCVALAVTSSVANAQLWYGASVNYPTGGDAASTPASGIGHAAADIIRAQGMFNESTANSILKFEQARRQYLENQNQWTDLVLSRQRVLQAEHERQHEETRARNIRYREEEVWKTPLPPRLASNELNPGTGAVSWPRALQRDTFALDRIEIESLLAKRADKGSTSELMEQLDNKTQMLRTDLRDHIRELRTQEYLQARRFVDSLALESQFPADEPVIARKDGAKPSIQEVSANRY